MTGVETKGFRELRTKLAAMTRAAAGRSLLNAVESGALVLENESKNLVPVKTGNLRRSIHHETAETSATKAVVDIGTDVDYARRIEFGFTGRDSRGRMYNQAPRSFMRASVVSKGRTAQAEAIDALRDELNRVIV